MKACPPANKLLGSTLRGFSTELAARRVPPSFVLLARD